MAIRRKPLTEKVVEIDPALHQKLKFDCLSREIKIKDVVNKMLSLILNDKEKYEQILNDVVSDNE